MQYLYLIRNGESWFFKIGIAQDVESRLAQLQTGNPVDLSIESCYEFQSADHVEKVLHQKWNSVRKRGEWFDLTARDLGQFEEICTLLGGVPYVPDSEISTPDEVEEAEEFAEPAEGAKWDFAAMFADGWRIEKSTSRGKNGVYWCWRKGGENLGRKYLYGGLISDLPYPICDMRKIYRDGATDGNMPVSRKDEE